QGVMLGAPTGHLVGEHLRSFGGVGGMSTQGSVELRDILITGASYSFQVGGVLTLDRAVIRGGVFGIADFGAQMVNISNTIVSGTDGLAIDLPNASGSIISSTIVDS